MKIPPEFDSNSSLLSVHQNYFQNAYQRLQESMQTMHAKIDETNGLLIKKHEWGALQEEKDKLQAQVEDLTLQLKLEKSLKTNLEEEKGKEIMELKNSLKAMQAEVNMDRESSQKKIDKLSTDVEELKSLLESERNRKQGELMNRLDEKFTYIESENKINSNTWWGTTSTKTPMRSQGGMPGDIDYKVILKDSEIMAAFEDPEVHAAIQDVIKNPDNLAKYKFNFKVATVISKILKVIDQKPKRTLDEISHDLCPVFSIQQLYRITTMYWDDSYSADNLSPDVISNIKVMMSEYSKNAVSSSFLLDDDSRNMPFSVDDLFKSVGQIDIEDVGAPLLICYNSGFSFLS